MSKFLDSTGLTYLWQKIKGAFATKSEVEAVDNKLANYLPTSQKGVANGLATLDGEGKVPSSQLPSFVDDVLEFEKQSSFPSTGETGKIYVAKDTNLTYRWSGSGYIEISSSLALGETASTAYAGDKGKALADKLSGIEAGAQKNTVTSVAGKTGAVTLTKSDVGLGNVTNDKQVKGLSSGTTNGHVVVFGSDGYTVADSGKTLLSDVPADAVFTDTHYEAKEVAATSATGKANGAVTGNGVYLNVVENDTVRSSHKIVGAGVAKVTSDANGNITITATATNDSALSNTEIDEAIAAAE